MSAAKRKGSAWEAAVVDYLRLCGWPNAERRVIGGSRDRGDIAGIVGVVIEAKSAARFEPSAWLTELGKEIANDRAELGAVWVKRRGKGSPGQGIVIMDGTTFARLLNAAGY